MTDDIQRAYAALRAVPNANVEEVSMRVALWALGELEKARKELEAFAMNTYDPTGSLHDKYKIGHLLQQQLAAYLPSLNPPAESC
jgi:hypothetical protein